MDKFLNNKWVMKGVAFLIALLLWTVVALDETPETNVSQTEEQMTIENVPVEPIYDEELYSLIEMQDTVQLLLSGRRSLLNASMLRSDSYRIYADLTELEAGEHMVELQHEGFPAEVDVRILPKEIRVVLEEKEARPVQVDIELEGELPEGYTLGKPVVSPEEVHVIAPVSILEQMDAVRGVVQLDESKETIVEEVDLEAIDAEGRTLDVEISPATVEVEVPVTSPSANVPLALNLQGELPDGLSLEEVESNVDEIEVFASEEELANLDQIEQSIDLSEITSSRTLEMDIAQQSAWEKTDPASIEVDVKVGPTRERLFSGLPIEIRGLADDHELEFIDPSSGEISLSIYGTEERVDALSDKDIVVFVDVSDVGTGEHTISATVELPQYLTYSPEDIPLKIKIDERNGQ